MRLRVQAPGKVNLCLFLGRARDDGRHELLTVFQSLSLADTLTATVGGEPPLPAPAAPPATSAPPDSVSCVGVEGPNLVDAVLAELRRRGWSGPPLAIEIVKRIPVAAGMAGGSADAAAALRLADAVAAVAPEEMFAIAAALGSDIPSQITPGVALGSGAGDIIEPLAPLREHAYVVIPSTARLSTAAVYREADRLGLGRTDAELRDLRARLTATLRPARAGASLPDESEMSAGHDAPVPADLIINDLQPAALSLCPQIAEPLAAARELGADTAIVSGSGPTVAGIWWGRDAAARAASAQTELAEHFPGTVRALPVGPRSSAVERI